MDKVELRWPDEEMLPSYAEALRRGFSPSSTNPDLAQQELEKIAADPAGFVVNLIDMEGTGPPVELPDGSTAPRIPGYRKWIWDGEYCGSIGLRWMPPSDDRAPEELPPHVLGHIGYNVVEWKRRRGYASWALRTILPEATTRGLSYVELTCDADNVASRKVIESAGGELYERFTMPAAHGGHPGLRFRIALDL